MKPIASRKNATVLAESSMENWTEAPRMSPVALAEAGKAHELLESSEDVVGRIVLAPWP